MRPEMTEVIKVVMTLKDGVDDQEYNKEQQ